MWGKSSWKKRRDRRRMAASRAHQIPLYSSVRLSSSSSASSSSSSSSFSTSRLCHLSSPLPRILTKQTWPWIRTSSPSRRLPRLPAKGPLSASPFIHQYTPRANFFGFATKTSSWSANESPYDVLGVEWNIDEDGIKSAYRRMAKQYHPDVYDGSIELREGETAESRFIRIQAAYELLADKEQRRQYDYDNRINPMKVH